MAIGWWLFVHVAEWEASRPRLPSSPLACTTADLHWSRLAFEIEWRERVVVEMRGVLRSRAERAIPAWCLSFARGLRVQLIGTGRRELDRAIAIATEWSVSGAGETWRVQPLRPLAPGETLVVRYRLETDAVGHLPVHDLVPTFGASADGVGSRLPIEVRHGDLPEMIEIALDYSISAVAAVPGELQRHWCRNDRRKLATRWRLPRRSTATWSPTSRVGAIWVREASLERCRYPASRRGIG